MSSYHCRFDDKDRTAASGFYDVADRLLTLNQSALNILPLNHLTIDACVHWKQASIVKIQYICRLSADSLYYSTGMTFSIRVPREPLIRIVAPERCSEARWAASSSDVLKKYALESS